MMLKAIFFNMLGRITTLNGPSRPWGIANGYSRPVTEIHVHKIMLKKHNKTCPFCCLCSFPGIFFSLKKQHLYSTHLFVNPFLHQSPPPHSSSRFLHPQVRAQASWIWHRYLSKVLFAASLGDTQREITAHRPMKSSS